MNFIDLKGQEFGSLKVLEYLGKSKWLCECKCGNKIIVLGGNLKRGNTQSCGCKRKKQSRINGKNNEKYVQIKQNTLYKKLYTTWIGIRRRCKSKKSSKYKDYGGRGIDICKQWDNFENFFEWSINNGVKSNLSIDRIDNNGNYEPNNCRWATSKIQQRNRRNSHIVKFKSNTYCITELAEKYNINIRTLRGRLKRGWTIEKAITMEVL